MQPYELVKANYKLPAGIVDRDWQMQVINDQAPMERTGKYAEVGTGKTFLSTMGALYKLKTEGRTTVVTMPPILIPGWLRWLRKIEGITVLDYRGSPKERKALNLHSADFIAMSIQVFKRDFDYLMDTFAGNLMHLIVDEATAIKNIESANYKCTKHMVDQLDCHVDLLTGTPLNTPADAYAYIKTLSPLSYKNHKQFEMTHVSKKDFFGKVTAWENLDLLKENMKINSVRILRHEVLNTPVPIYQPMFYDLYPEHWKLYRAIVDEQLDLLPNRDVVDAITEAKLKSFAQQIIWNFAYFASEPGAVSAPYELLDEIKSELAGRKLLCFGNFKRTMRTVREHLGTDNVGVLNSEFSGKQKETFIQAFINNPNFKDLLIHPDSGGKGLDGLQHVCSDVLFLECPSSPIAVDQCVGRVARDGQTQAPLIRMAIANKTVQVTLHTRLLKNDEQAGYVQGTYQSLRAALYGEEE